MVTVLLILVVLSGLVGILIGWGLKSIDINRSEARDREDQASKKEENTIKYISEKLEETYSGKFEFSKSRVIFQEEGNDYSGCQLKVSHPYIMAPLIITVTARGHGFIAVKTMGHRVVKYWFIEDGVKNAIRDGLEHLKKHLP